MNDRSFMIHRKSLFWHSPVPRPVQRASRALAERLCNTFGLERVDGRWTVPALGSYFEDSEPPPPPETGRRR